jgi:hypothetical protein
MSVWSYLRDITGVFFNWWWAAITGIAGLLPLFGFPGSSITISNVQASLVIFLMFTLLFLAISVLVQGYKWYSNAHNSPIVESCVAASSSAEQEVFSIRSIIPLEPGQISTILRTTNRGTGCLGIVKVERVVGPLVYQCIPVWVAPVHKNDLSQNRVHLSELKASLLINEADLYLFAREARRL